MRGILGNLALALPSALAVLVAGELFVRVFVGPVPPPNVTHVRESIRVKPIFPGVPFVFKPNAETVHEFDSNARGYFDADWTLTYRTNSMGPRNPEVTLEKRRPRFVGR